jgi:uncharacterized FlaG/YvyC family protein
MENLYNYLKKINQSKQDANDPLGQFHKDMNEHLDQIHEDINDAIDRSSNSINALIVVMGLIQILFMYLSR